jgi:hypothetical protein
MVFFYNHLNLDTILVVWGAEVFLPSTVPERQNVTQDFEDILRASTELFSFVLSLLR